MPVAAPADRRFLRAHVKPGRRHGTWRARLRVVRLVVVPLVLLALGYASAMAIADARLLRISRVVVSGNDRLSNGEVLALLEGLRGRSILRVALPEWRGRLLASRWVAEADLRRVLPSTIEVRIAERRPIGIGRFGTELCLVDEHGAVIDEYGPRYAEFDLPIIDGLNGGAGAAVALDERRADLAGRLLAAVRRRPEVARRISQIDVRDPRDAVVTLDKDTALVRVGDDDFLDRLQSYIDLAPTLRQQVPEIDYVDLRYGERVFVGAGNAGTARRPGAAARDRRHGAPPARF